jgi:hypothetical protein
MLLRRCGRFDTRQAARALAHPSPGGGPGVRGWRAEPGVA